MEALTETDRHRGIVPKMLSTAANTSITAGLIHGSETLVDPDAGYAGGGEGSGVSFGKRRKPQFEPPWSTPFTFQRSERERQMNSPAPVEFRDFQKFSENLSIRIQQEP